MKIRVFLNKIKVDIQDDFQHAREYFAYHGVFIEWEFIESDIKGYKVINQNFGSVGTRLQITGHEDRLPLSKDCIAIFAFNGNEFPLSGIPTSKCEKLDNGILLTLMTYKEGDVIGETFTTLIHELMHALIKQFSWKGIIVEDCMDLLFKEGQWLPYYRNDHAYDEDSNFGEQWKRLYPYISALENSPMPAIESKPRVVINRLNDDGIQTTGLLTMSNFTCKTLERPSLGNKPNISNIPKGVYNCVWSFSPRLLRFTYEIQDVVGRSGIRIHSGNFFFNSAGCILLGDSFQDINADGRKDILNSKKTIKTFEEILQKRPFTLTIL